MFLLPSREDPFPLVTLEAAECGLPTICFAEAGGMPDFVGEDAGFVVPFGNIEAMADKVVALMENQELRQKMGAQARKKLLSSFTFAQTTPKILSVCRQVAGKKPAVSVIVPNYNHAKFLTRRLDTIYNQNFQDFEVILLDDDSTDDSTEILERYLKRVDTMLVQNEKNTGSTFQQWLKGIDLSKGDILWIAESDDACEPEFLGTLVPAFRNSAVKLAYADSWVMDENDKVTGDYVNGNYLTSLSKTKWKSSYDVSANQEINDGLGVKNTILNASAVLFRKFELDENSRRALINMRIAGDWYFIVKAIKDGNVFFDSKKLNYHRRHAQSVIGKTLTEKKIKDFFQEFFEVQNFIFNNYTLDNDFRKKWENYLIRQWKDFCPHKKFNDLMEYYPYDKMRNFIEKTDPPEGRK